jgi:hypothetical protein
MGVKSPGITPSQLLPHCGTIGNIIKVEGGAGLCPLQVEVAATSQIEAETANLIL